MTIFTNATIFNGQVFEANKTVAVQQHKIISCSHNTTTENVMDMQSDYLVPAFIDVQLYGGNGQLFSEHPSVAALQATYAFALAGGATQILPTVATNSFEKMVQAIEAVRAYQQMGLPGVVGLHLEGPYINPIKKGAHMENHIAIPTVRAVSELLHEGKDIIKMITLAPEVCSDIIIEMIQKAGIIISAGHSNATYQQAINAFDKGIHTATHLFNAMSPLHHREPGLAGAVMDAENVSCSVVADGYHVDYAAIRIAKKIMKDRLFLITDAVTTNTTGAYQHQLQGNKYVVADGTLSGSSLTLLQAVKNCVTHVGIGLEEALRMASLYPAKVLAIDNSFGKIKEGYAAEMLWLTKELELKGVYTNGNFTKY